MKVKPRYDSGNGLKSTIKLVIGLGNPEPDYKNTYHNIGFLALDYLAENPQFSDSKFIKSDVYMNQSGDFVKKAVKKYKIKPAELMIVHDDNDIELGKYKISFARNSAGHHGVDSIINFLGTKNFWRLRIGIGKIRKSAKKKAANLVLKKIARSDWEILKKTFSEIKL